MCVASRIAKAKNRQPLGAFANYIQFFYQILFDFCVVSNISSSTYSMLLLFHCSAPTSRVRSVRFLFNPMNMIVSNICSRYVNLFSIKYFRWANGSCDKSPATVIRNMICVFFFCSGFDFILCQSFPTLFLFDSQWTTVGYFFCVIDFAWCSSWRSEFFIFRWIW